MDELRHHLAYDPPSLLGEQLRKRQLEIVQAVSARVFAIPDSTEANDPDYLAGVRGAISAAIAYGITGIRTGGQGVGLPPDELLAQARCAARIGVGLDTVLRRYVVGHTLLGDFAIREAQREDSISVPELNATLRMVGNLLDQIVDSITIEYTREAEQQQQTAEKRHVYRVRRLLAGALPDGVDLGYNLGGSHVGMILAGSDATRVIGSLAMALKRPLLTVRADAGLVWAWLGGESELSSQEVLRQAGSLRPDEGILAVGEPGLGIEGWRLSHHQARAALSVARHEAKQRVRYADVVLAAAALNDNILRASLRDLYLAPLEKERDGGLALRQTLAAYFAAGQNAASASAVLGVSRKTVSARIRIAEERIGQPVQDCAAEFETALRLTCF